MSRRDRGRIGCGRCWRRGIRRCECGRRCRFDGCLNTRGYGRLAGGLGIESRRDLRFDGGLYIDLRVVAARSREEDDRGKGGQEDLADHAES